MANPGQFKKGQSGNPAGRPRTASTELRQQLKQHGPALVDKCVALALEGDVQALRICLDRIAPPLKAESGPVHVSIPQDAGIAGTSRAFINAVAAGELASDQAAVMVSALSGLSRQVEIDELAARIEALETTTKAGARLQ